MLRRWIASLLAVAAGVTAAHAQDLAPGVRAPDFALQGSDGRQYRLADFAGRQGLVLAWFPKAFTPG